MKKIVLLAFLSCFVGLFILAGDVPTTQGPGDGSCGCPGSGGTVHYEKFTEICVNDESRTEVRCVVGGDELCAPQNCP